MIAIHTRETIAKTKETSKPLLIGHAVMSRGRGRCLGSCDLQFPGVAGFTLLRDWFSCVKRLWSHSLIKTQYFCQKTINITYSSSLTAPIFSKKCSVDLQIDFLTNREIPGRVLPGHEYSVLNILIKFVCPVP